MARRTKFFGLDEALKHSDHRRPKTRREFISQGFQTGAATVVGTSTLGATLLNARNAHADLSGGLSDDITACDIKLEGAGKIPFICFDLAGGANISGSNVLVGGRGGQMDFLTKAGYSKQGLPSGMTPDAVNPDVASDGRFYNTELGLAFHSDSGFLRGILEKTQVVTRENINGAVIAARSENDTGNNPHNPMYGINMYGARGALLALCGSRSSESGGNSMSPSAMVNNAVRPTKIDRPSDVTGLVDVGDLTALLSKEEIVAVMESMYHISKNKMDKVKAIVDEAERNQRLRKSVSCKYLEAAGLADRYSDPTQLDPLADPDIVGATGIFSNEEITDREFRKTASVMKMVVEGYAGAGTITMGGYDYHTGDRATGEQRDLRAGRCMGACLEYAMRKGKPLMMYVFSDGSVFSNGALDNSIDGRGKGVWTGDNQQTASSFFLVYNPGGAPKLIAAPPEAEPMGYQIGYMRGSGDVETGSSPAANNVNQLVQTVMLNYMALHGDQGQFATTYSGGTGFNHGLGGGASIDRLTAFQALTGTGLPPVLG